MASEDGQPVDPPGGRRRRPPTIELEATEVGKESPDVGSTSADARHSALAWLNMPWRLVGAGAGGAAAVVIVVLVLWLAGVWPRAQDPMVALGPRLGAIEAQLRDLAARPQPAIDPKALDELKAQLNALDPKALDEMRAQLAKLEAAIAAPHPPAPDPAVLNRVTATDESVKALAAALEQLTRRTDAVAAQLAELQTAARASGAERDQIAALANKIAALEQTNQAIRDELAKRAVASASDRAVRLAMLASALRNAVERGDPFGAELAAVKPLGVDAATFSALEPYAAKGVPSSAQLGRELAVLIEPMRRAAGAASPSDGFIGRLQANAEKLVRIHRVGEVTGDAPAAILSRIESKAAQADIDGALAELTKLPDPVRAPAQDWISKAKARQSALAAASRLVTGALAALKTP